jgi:hemoglobin
MSYNANEVQEDHRQDGNSPVKKNTVETTQFQRIGGAAGVDRLVEAFYLRMDSLPAGKAIRALHADDLSSTKEVLKRYLSEWMGGPPLYSQERGHPRLRQRHLRFKIGEAERDAWLSCMRAALDEAVDEVTLRDGLYGSFVKLADWMRNQPGNPHDGRAAGADART